MRTSSKLAALFAVLTASSAHAATLIPVPPVPGSILTIVSGINDDNIIVGSYETADGIEHGFYGTLDGQYTTFDFDAVNDSGTSVRDIDNKGNMTGTANLTQLNTVDLVEFERFANGSMKLITDHGTLVHGVSGGISPKGTFAAEDWHADNTVDGFVGKNAKIKSQVDLGFTTTRTRPRDVTNSGDIVGYFKGTSGGFQGFLLHGGTTTVINNPDVNAVQTELEGVNAGGTITGFWYDSDFDQFAFTYDEKKATFTPITIPGFPNTSADGVNSAGLIAVQGYSSDFFDTAPYIYCPNKKSKCPAGGTEIADAKPVRMPAGIMHRVPQGAPKPLTAAHAAALSRQ